jgi:hypothetical protein
VGGESVVMFGKDREVAFFGLAGKGNLGAMFNHKQCIRDLSSAFQVLVSELSQV